MQSDLPWFEATSKYVYVCERKGLVLYRYNQGGDMRSICLQVILYIRVVTEVAVGAFLKWRGGSLQILLSTSTYVVTHWETIWSWGWPRSCTWITDISHVGELQQAKIYIFARLEWSMSWVVRTGLSFIECGSMDGWTRTSRAEHLSKSQKVSRDRNNVSSLLWKGCDIERGICFSRKNYFRWVARWTTRKAPLSQTWK